MGNTANALMSDGGLDGRLNSIEAWIAQNPLRQWRQAQTPRISLRTAAALFGVGLYTMQSWESGNSFPTADNLRYVAAQTGDATLAERWEQWYQDGPATRPSNDLA